MNDQTISDDLQPEPALMLPDHRREKRIAKLALLGMAVIMIFLLPSAAMRTIFTIGTGLLLLTWIDYAAQERGKRIGIWMKALIAIGGMVLAQAYLRIIALILIGMLHG